MDIAKPYLALLQPVRAATLLALRRTVAPMTGREVARRAGVSQPAALSALNHLVEHGVVRSQPAGRAKLYTLNAEHLLVAAVDAVFDVRAELVKRIAAAISNWELQPLNVSLFGSVARGDGDTESDIDLMVVRPLLADEGADGVVWQSQLDTLVHEIEAWTGNRAAPMVLGADELRAMSSQKHRLLEDVRRDGLLITGAGIDRILLSKPQPQTAGAR